MRYDYANKEKLSEAEHEEDGRALTSSHLMNFSPSWSAFETSTEPARTATVDTLGELRGLCWVDLGALSGRVDVRAAAVAVVSADAAISRFNLHSNEFYSFNTWSILCVECKVFFLQKSQRAAHLQQARVAH